MNCTLVNSSLVLWASPSVPDIESAFFFAECESRTSNAKVEFWRRYNANIRHIRVQLHFRYFPESLDDNNNILWFYSSSKLT